MNVKRLAKSSNFNQAQVFVSNHNQPSRPILQNKVSQRTQDEDDQSSGGLDKTIELPENYPLRPVVSAQIQNQVQQQFHLNSQQNLNQIDHVQFDMHQDQAYPWQQTQNSEVGCGVGRVGCSIVRNLLPYLEENKEEKVLEQKDPIQVSSNYQMSYQIRDESLDATIILNDLHKVQLDYEAIQRQESSKDQQETLEIMPFKPQSYTKKEFRQVIANLAPKNNGNTANNSNSKQQANYLSRLGVAKSSSPQQNDVMNPSQGIVPYQQHLMIQEQQQMGIMNDLNQDNWLMQSGHFGNYQHNGYKNENSIQLTYQSANKSKVPWLANRFMTQGHNQQPVNGALNYDPNQNIDQQQNDNSDVPASENYHQYLGLPLNARTMIPKHKKTNTFSSNMQQNEKDQRFGMQIAKNDKIQTSEQRKKKRVGIKKDKGLGSGQTNHKKSNSTQHQITRNSNISSQKQTIVTTTVSHSRQNSNQQYNGAIPGNQGGIVQSSVNKLQMASVNGSNTQMIGDTQREQTVKHAVLQAVNQQFQAVANATANTVQQHQKSSGDTRSKVVKDVITSRKVQQQQQDQTVQSASLMKQPRQNELKVPKTRHSTNYDFMEANFEVDDEDRPYYGNLKSVTAEIKQSPGKEDLLKQLRAVFERFLKGEITKDQAQLLDNQLIQIHRKNNSSGLDSKRQMMKKQQQMDIKVRNEIAEKEKRDQSNPRRSNSAHKRGHQQRESIDQYMGSEFENFYQRQVEFQRKSLEKLNKIQYEQAEKELIECLSQREKLRSSLRQSGFTELQHQDSLKKSFSFLNSNTTTVQTINRYQINNKSADSTAQKSNFKQPADFKHSTTLSQDLDRKLVFNQDLAGISSSKDKIQGFSSSQKSSFSAEKNLMSPDFFRRLSSPIIKTYKERNIDSSATNSPDEIFKNKGGCNLFEELKKKKAFQKQKKKVFVNQLTKDIKRFIEKYKEMYIISLEMESSELTTDIFKELIFQLKMTDLNNKNFQEITDQLQVDIRKATGEVKITLDHVINFFKNIYETKDDELKPLWNKHQPLIIRREDKKRAQHKDRTSRDSLTNHSASALSLLNSTSQHSRMNQSVYQSSKRISNNFMPECTFTPILSQRTDFLVRRSRENSAQKLKDALSDNNSNTEGNIVTQAVTILESSVKGNMYDKGMLYEKIKHKKLDDTQKKLQKHQTKECTFRPKITQLPKTQQQNVGVEIQIVNSENQSQKEQRLSHVKSTGKINSGSQLTRNQAKKLSSNGGSNSALQSKRSSRSNQQHLVMSNLSQLQKLNELKNQDLNLQKQELISKEERAGNIHSQTSIQKQSVKGKRSPLKRPNYYPQTSRMQNGSIPQSNESTNHNSNSGNATFGEHGSFNSNNNQYHQSTGGNSGPRYQSYLNRNMCSTIISERNSERTIDDNTNDKVNLKTNDLVSRSNTSSARGTVLSHKTQADLPLLHVDIRHGQDGITRLSIYEGDDVTKRVHSFAQIFSISTEVQSKLILYIETQIARFKDQKLNNLNSTGLDGQNMMKIQSQQSERSINLH